jgi:hypothetical protein
MSTMFARFHPNLIVGGTYCGQIVLWDNRSNKQTPVQRTPLSAKAHTVNVFFCNMPVILSRVHTHARVKRLEFLQQICFRTFLWVAFTQQNKILNLKVQCCSVGQFFGKPKKPDFFKKPIRSVCV